jgi:hypothetical protein
MLKPKAEYLVFLAALATAACDRWYDVRGQLVIGPSARAAVVTPAVLCTGRGGPPDTSGMYAHPVADERAGVRGYLLCRRPAEPERVPYKDGVLYGSIPRRMHIYAFAEPDPDSQALCDLQPTLAIVPVRAWEWSGYRRCYSRRKPSTDMEFVVTYDDRQPKTWMEGEGGWLEERDIVLR